jgi:hypothetical protein
MNWGENKYGEASGVNHGYQGPNRENASLQKSTQRYYGRTGDESVLGILGNPPTGQTTVNSLENSNKWGKGQMNEGINDNYFKWGGINRKSKKRKRPKRTRRK